MTGRNETCPCGSGKKYKNCHGRASSSTRARPAEGPERWSSVLEAALARDDHATRDLALAELVRIASAHPRTFFYQALRAQLDGRIELALDFYAKAARTQYRHFPADVVQVMAASKAVDTAMGKFPGGHSRGWECLLGEPAVVTALEASLRGWRGRSPPATRQERDFVANAWYKLAAARRQGPVDAEACELFCVRALELNPDHHAARSTLLFTLNYDLHKSPEEIYAMHVVAGDYWASRFPVSERSFTNERTAEKVLRVAYLSSDFRHHPVAYFILPVLERHDRGKVQSFVYHLHATRDDYTEQAAQSCGEFRHVADLDDRALSRQIETDGIDILVDLNGTSGEGRLTLLAQRAAPIQMTWLGSPNTTGLPTVDYRIVDRQTDPPPHAQDLSRERLLYLPRLFSVYDPRGTLPPVEPGPCTRTGHLTYGSFNNVAKINRPLLRCWAQILERVPGSRLLLKYPTLDFEPLRNEILTQLETLGLDPSRITLLGKIASRHGHLESYSQVDIQLDTFPYHGTTTTCESLLMGVPVVTRAGADHRSRVGVSLLTSVGRQEWIAHDEAEYVDLAVRLGEDRAALAATRARLREEVQRSALMDAPRFTRELEEAYRDAWLRWCSDGRSDPH